MHALRPDAVEHQRCRAWLEACVNDVLPFALTSSVLAGVVRVLTHPRVFDPPSDRTAVLKELQRLLQHPRAVRVEPGPRHWSLFVTIADEAGVRGNLVPDAWLAAVAIEHHCTLVTLDRDFARFRRLRAQTPEPPREPEPEDG